MQTIHKSLGYYYHYKISVKILNYKGKFKYSINRGKRASFARRKYQDFFTRKENVEKVTWLVNKAPYRTII